MDSRGAVDHYIHTGQRTDPIGIASDIADETNLRRMPAHRRPAECARNMNTGIVLQTLYQRRAYHAACAGHQNTDCHLLIILIYGLVVAKRARDRISRFPFILFARPEIEGLYDSDLCP